MKDKKTNVNGMRALTILFYTGLKKTVFFETESDAIDAYHKLKNDKRIEKLSLNYTHTLKIGG